MPPWPYAAASRQIRRTAQERPTLEPSARGHGVGKHRRRRTRGACFGRPNRVGRRLVAAKVASRTPTRRQGTASSWGFRALRRRFRRNSIFSTSPSPTVPASPALRRTTATTPGKVVSGVRKVEPVYTGKLTVARPPPARWSSFAAKRDERVISEKRYAICVIFPGRHGGATTPPPGASCGPQSRPSAPRCIAP